MKVAKLFWIGDTLKWYKIEQTQKDFLFSFPPVPSSHCQRQLVMLMFLSGLSAIVYAHTHMYIYDLYVHNAWAFPAFLLV